MRAEHDVNATGLAAVKKDKQLIAVLWRPGSIKMHSSKTLADLVRVKKGSQVAGVCSGLEACDRGPASMWRILFFVGSIFLWVPFFVYIGMAMSLPQVETPEEAKRGGKQITGSGERGKSRVTVSGDASEVNSLESAGSGGLSSKQIQLEKDLAYYKKLHENDMISDQEYEKYRKMSLEKNFD